MPRTVAIRASYQQDAAFLLRLAEAIDKDPAVSVEKKREAIEQCNSLAMAIIHLRESNADTAKKAAAASNRR